MPKAEIIVRHQVGLHARPAAAFVKLASSFPCAVTIRNITASGSPANAKSILSVLALGVQKDYSIEIATEGDQADEALDALKALVANNFGE